MPRYVNNSLPSLQNSFQQFSTSQLGPKYILCFPQFFCCIPSDHSFVVSVIYMCTLLITQIFIFYIIFIIFFSSLEGLLWLYLFFGYFHCLYILDNAILHYRYFQFSFTLWYNEISWYFEVLVFLLSVYLYNFD